MSSRQNVSHDWTLWTPMDDGSGRWSRRCQDDDCGLIQTAEDEYDI